MDSKPSVSVTALNDETIIEICQASHRVSVTVSEFKSLMFVLRSIDEGLRQNAKKKVAEQIFEPHQLSSAGESDERLRKNAKTVEQIFEPLQPFLDAETLKTSGESVFSDEYDPESKRIKVDYADSKTVRDQLLGIYCDHFCDKIPEKLVLRCSGCHFGSTSRNDHDVCKLLPRKEKIDLVFADVLNELEDSSLRAILAERCWNRALPYNEGMYIVKDVLFKNNAWVRKLKNKIDKCL